MDASDALDLSKENIQPLRQGRKAAHLKTALQAQTDPVVQQMLLKTREEFEYKIRTYEGSDPLESYFNYIIWLEQCYPKTNRECNLHALLEDTLLKFKDCENYKQDPRFVQLMVKYIGMQSNPLELYQLVYDQGLGTMCSFLYKAWAEEFDKLNDIKKADKIYSIGINCRAEPLRELKNAHVQFQLSVARRMIEGSLQPLSTGESSRTVLSSLKSSKLRSSRSSRGAAGVLSEINATKAITDNQQNHGFQVYQEVESAPSEKKNFNFPKGSMSERENTLQPGKWNQKHKQIHKMPAVPTTPSFAIHEDPEASYSNLKSDFKPRALKLRKEDFNPLVAVFEPQDPTKVPMYPKNLVYVGGRDVQLEEIRAVQYWKIADNIEKEKKPCYESTELNRKTAAEQNPTATLENDNSHDCLESYHSTFPKNLDSDDKVSACVPRTIVESQQPGEINNSMQCSTISIPRHSPSTSMTVNTRNALHIIDEMWKSGSSESNSSKPTTIPFEIFEDAMTNPAAFDSYLQRFENNSGGVPKERVQNPFSQFGKNVEISNKLSFDPFDIAPKMHSPSHGEGLFEPKNMFGFSNNTGQQNEGNYCKFLSGGITREDCLLDATEQLAYPMEALVVDENLCASRAPLPLIVDANIEEKALGPENKENVPPKKLDTLVERRSLTGILTPSNIPVAAEQYDSSDYDEEIEERTKSLHIEEETCTTKAFTVPLPCSTPFSKPGSSRNSRRFLIYNGSQDENDPSSGCHQKILFVNQLSDASKKMSSFSPTLSFILENSENSKENKGSSGSPNSVHIGVVNSRLARGPSFQKNDLQ